MGYSAEGTVDIDLVEFWQFVNKFVPEYKGAEICFGVPRIQDNFLFIDYAVSTECHPEDWAQPPKTKRQWNELRSDQKKVAAALKVLESGNIELAKEMLKELT